MYFQLKGKVVALTPQQGTKKDGSTWRKVSVVIEWNEQQKYDRHAVFTIWGDTFDQMGIEQGKYYEFDCDIDAREFNGKWYNDITAFRLHNSSQGNGGFANDQFGEPAF